MFAILRTNFEEEIFKKVVAAIELAVIVTFAKQQSFTSKTKLLYQKNKYLTF